VAINGFFNLFCEMQRSPQVPAVDRKADNIRFPEQDLMQQGGITKIRDNALGHNLHHPVGNVDRRLFETSCGQRNVSGLFSVVQLWNRKLQQQRPNHEDILSNRRKFRGANRRRQ
jgi:hypothetical protein